MPPRLPDIVDRLDRLPAGRAIASRAYRAAAPYFLSIPVHLDEIGPGRAVASMPARPWTRNHLGGVHAIAQCNLAEYVMGAAAEASVPPTHRWLPKGMTVDYRTVARGRLTATATVDVPAIWNEGVELPIAVAITDEQDVEVTTIEIRIWVTPRPVGG
ncbi:MAG: hotdog fold domain-containing protein [Solirubrobacteraceae bacterium]